MKRLLDLDEDLLPELDELEEDTFDELELGEDVPAYQRVRHDIVVHSAMRGEEPRSSIYGA